MALALMGIVLMLPALKAGLFGDDLVQRPVQFTPSQLPAHMIETGFASSESGKLGTVLLDQFAFGRGAEVSARLRDYGIAPWWAPENWQAALLRPLTAFTHWLDYRFYPDTPALMHAHNILWFAVAVFLVATLYRNIATFAGARDQEHPDALPSGLQYANRDLEESLAESGALLDTRSGMVAVALAAGLWLLDKYTYFPVMFVANRGFIVSLVFGLLCMHAHLRWRTAHTRTWMCLSAGCLLLSLLADEAGVSTLAFVLAYALLLEPNGWRQRLESLVPVASVVIGWRAVYVALGYGVRNMIIYVDPGYSPWLFLKNFFPRAAALLGGQLSGLPPEIAIGLNPHWQELLTVFFAGFSVLCLVIFLPVLRRDAAARFWAVMMLLAVVPASTVVPLSKNLAFVALGAFGVVASFLVDFARYESRTLMPRPWRAMSCCVTVWLVLAHIPGAVAGRIALGLASPLIPARTARACSFEGLPEIGERDVVVVNDPTCISTVVPFDRAYRHRPLPKTVNILVPGFTRLEVKRPDAATLVVRAREADLFDCVAGRPIHLCYVCKTANDLLFGGRPWMAGEQVRRKGFVAEILEISRRGAPRAVVFHFDRPLESEERVWLFFDWRRREHSPFVLPPVGGSVEIAGPQTASR